MKKKIAKLILVGLLIICAASLAYSRWFSGPPKPSKPGVYLYEEGKKLIPLSYGNRSEIITRKEETKYLQPVTLQGLSKPKFHFNSNKVCILVKGDVPSVYLTEMRYSKIETINLGLFGKYTMLAECYLPKRNIRFLESNESDRVKYWGNGGVYQLVPSEELKEGVLYAISHGDMSEDFGNKFSFEGTGPASGVWSFQGGALEERMGTTRKLSQCNLYDNKHGGKNISIIMKEAEKLKDLCLQANVPDVAMYILNNKELLLQFPVERKDFINSKLLGKDSIFIALFIEPMIEGPCSFSVKGGAFRVLIDSSSYKTSSEVEVFFREKGIKDVIVQKVLSNNQNSGAISFYAWIPFSNFDLSNLTDSELRNKFRNKLGETFKIKRLDCISSKI